MDSNKIKVGSVIRIIHLDGSIHDLYVKFKNDCYGNIEENAQRT